MSSPVKRLVDHAAYRRGRLRQHWRSVIIGGHDTSKALWITSWQRSGSTWLAELLASPKGTRFVYEPANIPDLCFEGAQAAMIAPPLISPPHTAAVVKGLEGKVAHWWSDQFNHSHRPRRLVAKDVRGIGIAGTVAEQLDAMPIIILIRNPIDVATSIVRLGWFDPSYTAHDAFLAEVSRWCDYHERALRDERLSRALWVSYEELRANPTQQLTAIRDYLLTFSDTWNVLDVASLDTTRRSATDFSAQVGETVASEWIGEGQAILECSPFGAVYSPTHHQPLLELVDSLRGQ
ncbi:MAG: sulfotransferase [Actinobacteria bacterium]|nr:sulfotransferase [Actinomycetota bacterium]